MDTSNKILIIIPVHNEANNIARVISEAKEKCPFVDILVVNDGSEDSTEEIARKQQVKVINIPFQIGIGGAMQTGFIFASQNNYDIAVQLDGDGQHNPSQIKDLIQPLLNGQADVAIGSRFLDNKGYRPDFLHRLAIQLLSKMLLFLTGQKFTDPTSGFRAADKSAIGFFAENYPVDYPEAEVIILLLKRNFQIQELPAMMRPRLSGRSSIRGMYTIYYMVKVLEIKPPFHIPGFFIPLLLHLPFIGRKFSIFTKDRTYSIKNLEEKLNYVPRVSVYDGIKKTVLGCRK